MLTNREKHTLIENVLYSLDEAGIARGLGRLGNAGLGKIGKGVGKVKDVVGKAFMGPAGGIGLAAGTGATTGGIGWAAAANLMQDPVYPNRPANIYTPPVVSPKKKSMNFGQYAPVAGVAGLGAILGGIVGATSKSVRIAKLKKAIAKCGKNSECVEELEGALNKLDDSINWGALIGAAVGGGIAAGGYKYGPGAYNKVASKFKNPVPAAPATPTKPKSTERGQDVAARAGQRRMG